MLSAPPGKRTTHDHAIQKCEQTPSLEDREIVNRARRHPEAFAPLYERYVDGIFAYCFRRTSNKDQAADLTHQIFARALAALPNYEERKDPGSFRRWLFAIAHNLVVDTYRIEPTASPIDDVLDGLADNARSPEDEAIATEQRHNIHLAMQKLTSSQRRIVELRLAGLTGPEIATTLDMELAAVKSAQFRAYARLRKLLGDDHAPTKETAK